MTAQQASLSTCLCQTPLVCEPISRTQTSVPLTKAKPLPKKTPTGIKQSCFFTTQSNTKASPFPSLRVHSRHEGASMKCKPNCAPGGTLSKTRLASCSGGILAGSNWRILASRSGLILAGYSAGSIGKGYSAGYSAGSTGEVLWRDTRRDPPALAGCGGIHWRAALAGYSAGSTGEQLWRDTGRDTWRDPLALWRDTGRDPLASSSGGILGGIHWRAALAGYSEGSTDELL